MLPPKYQRIPELFLMFGLFFLSNIAVVINVIWLDPTLTLIQAVSWGILSSFSVLILYRMGLLTDFWDILRKNWMILPFVIFAGLSVIWSIYSAISFHKWLILLFTVIAGGYIGLRYSLREIIHYLSIFGVYILFLSILLVFFAPKIGIMNYHNIQGAWRGMYWHKNHMGLVAAFFNTLFLINVIYFIQSARRNIWLWLGMYVFSLIFVYQSDSVAAYITTLFLHGTVLLAVLLLKFGGKISKTQYVYFFAAAILISIVLYLNVDVFFGVFGRNTTLTGRTLLWSNLFSDYFSQRPFLGYGFNAFWYSLSHRTATQLAAGYPDPIVISDNGFIDILMNTGYIGLFLFLVFYFRICWQSIQHGLRAVDLIGTFPLILMIFISLANISWSLIFENENFFMLVMISALFCINKPSTVHERTFG
jgi:exopolysaccharide production protein ExoQ